MTSHDAALESRLEQLNKHIKREERRVTSDDTVVHGLKKQRLRLEETMAGIRKG